MANESKKVTGEATGEGTPQTGCSAGGTAPPNQLVGDEPVKSEKELKKEAAKKAKLDKFAQKQEKMAQQSKPKQDSKAVEKKEKTVILYDKPTKSGEKKDVSNDLPETYSPRYVEAAWYSWWESQGFFKPESNCPDLSQENPKGQFVIVIPPPNVTGSLHLGHALTTAVEDAITRWHRMHGKTTLWAPGCDHAGIATQVVVEKKIWRDEGKTRHDLGREEFVNRVWKWKNEKGDRIYDQFRLLGASVDWTRTTFTMEPKMYKAVMEAFVLLYERGLIYRSNRLVNWSCTLKSAISDIEVDKIEIPGRTFLSVPGYKDKVEFGVLVSFAYKMEDGENEIIVATTRVETMLGDSAIAVHPNDERYKKFHGKFAKHPFIDRRLPIVCDDFVDMNFGTGAVKITPAHDQNDYDCGKRNNLPFITMLDDEGNISEGCGQFSGMKRFEARKAVLAKLKELGHYRDTKDNAMVVPICSRSKDVIEPMLKYQWYVDCKEMGRKAVEAVRSGELKLIPESHNKTWFNWLENIRDWCISRQLWWGHRIPAYSVSISSKDLSSLPQEERWVVARSQEEAKSKAAAKFVVSVEEVTLTQDEDVLDTWFSSGLFPFGIFGWPDQTPDLNKFYPGTLLETGYDIIFFWVSRMVMLGQELMGHLPFKEVLLHPIVRDAHGRKMSKSLGNVIDPIDVVYGINLEGLHKMLNEGNLDPKEVEKAKAGQKADYPNGIPECGSDALRFALCSYMTQGRDINLDIKRVEGYRFFCNKIWNAFKLIQSSLGLNFKPLDTETLSGKESPLDLWMLSRVSAGTELAEQGFQAYDLPQATTACYNLWLYDLCDIYLEAIKVIMNGGDEEKKEAVRQTLYSSASVALRLLHPFMPFITEELYQRLPRRTSEKQPSICIASYPDVTTFGWKRNLDIEKDMSFAQSIVHSIRSLRAEYNLAKTKVKLSLKCDTQDAVRAVTPFLNTIQVLSLGSGIDLLPSGSNAPEGAAIVPVSGECEAFLHLKGVIDVNKEIERLRGKRSKLEGPLNKLKDFIASEDYSTKVPLDVQEANSQKLKSLEAELKRVDEAVEGIEKLCLSN